MVRGAQEDRTVVLEHPKAGGDYKLVSPDPSAVEADDAHYRIRVELKAGETKTVSFNITPEDLKFYNGDLKYDWEAGEFQIMIGGNSRDVKMASVNWNK